MILHDKIFCFAHELYDKKIKTEPFAKKSLEVFHSYILIDDRSNERICNYVLFGQNQIGEKNEK